MTRRSVLAAALVALVAGDAMAQERAFGTVTTVQLPRGRAPQAAALADVDGDGRDDLVIASSRRGRRAERSIQIHLRRREGDAFVATPDLVLDEASMPTDAVAFAVGDVHEDPGAEIVLFSASGAFAWRPRGPEDARFVKLAAGSFLWQLPDSRELFSWEYGVRDVDGDGLADVVLAEPGGWRVAVQRRSADGKASFPVVSAPRVPDDAGSDRPIGARRLDAKAKRQEVRIAITFGGDAIEEEGDLVDVAESVPAPQFVDWNGDGRADLLAQSVNELDVWLQSKEGRFADEPEGRYELPVPADRDRRLDVSYGAYAGDLDGDRRADYVMLAGDKTADDPRTQVLVYLQGRGRAPDPASPLFGSEGLPAQLLRIGGFAGSPQLVDVDGDGRRDLVVGAVQLSGALDVAKAAGKGTLDAELYVYRNLGDAFSDTPYLRFDVAVKAEGLRKARKELLARFFGDVTGDGIRDLLLHDDPERLRVFMTRRAGDGLVMIDEPLWELKVDDDVKLVVRESQRGPPELVIVEDTQVLHVRFP